MTLLQAFVFACASIGGALAIIAFGVGAAAMISGAFERHPALGVVVSAIVTILPVTLVVWFLSNLE